MTASWPDGPAAAKAGSTVRAQLDYIIWITEEVEPIGSHPLPEIEEWRRRVHEAYTAMIDSFTPGHGDPLPPDVPPTIRPGQWPDVPAVAIPGMHVRHQLTVLRTVARISRDDASFPRLPADVATWTARVQRAHDALDHGPGLPMPDSHRTAPRPAPEKAGRRRVRKPEAKRARSTTKKVRHATKSLRRAASARKAPARKKKRAR